MTAADILDTPSREDVIRQLVESKIDEGRGSPAEPILEQAREALNAPPLRPLLSRRRSNSDAPMSLVEAVAMSTNPHRAMQAYAVLYIGMVRLRARARAGDESARRSAVLLASIACATRRVFETIPRS